MRMARRAAEWVAWAEWTCDIGHCRRNLQVPVCHQSLDRADLDGEKVCRHQAFPVSSEKRRPRHVLISLRGRIDPVFSKNVRDRAAPNLMSQIGHCSLDPCVPPRSILKRHAQNEIDDLHDASGG
jgi:hypothetical protein